MSLSARNSDGMRVLKLAIVLGAFLSLAPYPAQATENEHTIHDWIDPYQLDIDFTKFCDFNDDAPISDKCYGFIGAIAEIVISENSSGPAANRQFPPACAWNLNTEQIFKMIRPWLREHVGT